MLQKCYVIWVCSHSKEIKHGKHRTCHCPRKWCIAWLIGLDTLNLTKLLYHTSKKNWSKNHMPVHVCCFLLQKTFSNFTLRQFLSYPPSFASLKSYCKMVHEVYHMLKKMTRNYRIRIYYSKSSSLLQLWNYRCALLSDQQNSLNLCEC